MAKGLACTLALCLLGNALCLPLDIPRWRREFGDNEVDSVDSGITLNNEASIVPMNPAFTLPPIKSTYEGKKRESQTADPFEDDDDDFEPVQTAPTGGGSNIMSLLNLASGLFSGSNGPNQPQNDQPQTTTTNPLWTLKMDILRAILQFGARILVIGSAGASNAITS